MGNPDASFTRLKGRGQRRGDLVLEGDAPGQDFAAISDLNEARVIRIQGGPPPQPAPRRTTARSAASADRVSSAAGQAGGRAPLQRQLSGLLAKD